MIDIHNCLHLYRYRTLCIRTITQKSSILADCAIGQRRSRMLAMRTPHADDDSLIRIRRQSVGDYSIGVQEMIQTARESKMDDRL